MRASSADQITRRERPKWDDPYADTAHGVAYVAKRQTDRDSAAPYRSRATVPVVVPGTGRLADRHVVQWSMDGFHNAQSSLGTNLLDGDSAPANADFARMRNRDQTAWTEQLGITVSDPVKFRRAAAEPAQTSSARAMWQWGTVCPATSPTFIQC